MQLFTKERAIVGSTEKGTSMKPRPEAPSGPPPAQGLYDPAHEHDACGVGFVVDIKGRKSHAIVRQALTILINLLHRGACGCEANTGDGAGILLQMPDKFLRKACARQGIPLPGLKEYGAGLVFLPRNPVQREKVQALIGSIVGQLTLGWLHDRQIQKRMPSSTVPEV